VSDEKDQEQSESGSRYCMVVRKAANLSAESWSDERISAIVRAVAPRNATQAQVAIFLATAQRYNLDPLLGEVWLADMGGQLRVVTGRDSYIKVASRNEGYRGIESGVVYSKDQFAVKRNDGKVQVQHVVSGFDRGDRVGAYCVVNHEGRPPVLILRRWEDFRALHGKPTWKAYPDDMLETRCIVAALKRMYNIAGLDTPDSIPEPEDLAKVDNEHAQRATHDTAESVRGAVAAVTARMRAARSQPAETPAETPIDAQAGAEEAEDADFEVVDDEPPTPPAAGQPEGPFDDGPTTPLVDEEDMQRRIDEAEQEIQRDPSDEELDLEIERQDAKRGRQ